MTTTSPDDVKLGACKACEAPIRWARNIDTDRGVPLDPDAIDPTTLDSTRGLVVEADDDRIADAGVTLRRGELAIHHLRNGEQPEGRTAYLTHFVTCPNADQFRKAGKGKSRG